MLGVFNTIKIGGKVIYRSNNFTLEREYIYAGEITTCTGDYHADVVGWRYSDMELSYDTLPQSMLNYLLELTGRSVEMEFVGMNGATVTENVIPTVLSGQVTRFTGEDGNTLWSGISLGLRFINAHN